MLTFDVWICVSLDITFPACCRLLMAQPTWMRKTRRQARRWNPSHCRWTHILWSLLTGLVLSRAAFVSPIARRAVGAGPEKDVDVEVMLPSLEATVEVVGENTSAPVRLLYSPGGLVSKCLKSIDPTQFFGRACDPLHCLHFLAFPYPD